VLLPMSAELWARKQKEHLRRGMELLQKYLFVVVTPFALLMLSFPMEIINILFGYRFIGGSIALQILSVGVIFNSLGTLNTIIFPSIGRPKINVYIITTAAVVNLLSNLILVPIYGIVGAAIATSFSFLIIMVFSTVMLKQYIKVTFPLGEWMKTVIAGLALVGVISYLKRALVMGVIPELVIIAASGFLVYGMLVFLLRVIDVDEVKKYLNMVKSTVLRT
jgi:O-antigen/teichoic acid export membrane protein